jgi:hypothetical protein
MSSHEDISKTSETERIESLRKILEGDQHRKIAYEEAFEIAQLLLDFYDNLADNSLGIGQVLLEREAV